MNTIREFLTLLKDLPILNNPNFYFGLFGLVVMFAPRFGVNFTPQEIGQLLTFLSLILGVSPPTVQFLQTRALQHRIDEMKTEAETETQEPTPPRPPSYIAQTGLVGLALLVVGGVLLWLVGVLCGNLGVCL